MFACIGSSVPERKFPCPRVVGFRPAAGKGPRHFSGESVALLRRPSAHNFLSLPVIGSRHAMLKTPDPSEIAPSALRRLHLGRRRLTLPPSKAVCPSSRMQCAITVGPGRTRPCLSDCFVDQRQTSSPTEKETPGTRLPYPCSRACAPRGPKKHSPQPKLEAMLDGQPSQCQTDARELERIIPEAATERSGPRRWPAPTARCRTAAGPAASPPASAPSQSPHPQSGSAPH